MTKNRIDYHVKFISGLFLAFIMAVGMSVIPEVKSSTNQTPSSNITGFHSALDTYVASELDDMGYMK